MGIRSKFQGKHTKNCILKTVLKKNSTVVVKMCPRNYLFCIPTNFLPQLFYIFAQIYMPIYIYLRHFATLAYRSFHIQTPGWVKIWIASKNIKTPWRTLFQYKRLWKNVDHFPFSKHFPSSFTKIGVSCAWCFCVVCAGECGYGSIGGAGSGTGELGRGTRGWLS